MAQKPIQDLVWFFGCSSADLGFRSNYKESALWGADLQEPSGQQCKAARRQSQIRSALLSLSAKHRNTLAIAYTPRRANGALSGRFGVLAGRLALAVIRSGKKPQMDDLKAYLDRLLEDSHRAYQMQKKERPSRKQIRQAKVDRFVRSELWPS